MSKQIFAPWTFEQVTLLNQYQRQQDAHPFTCENRANHPAVDGEQGVLVATVTGWICPYCTYRQHWAWAAMAEPAPEAFEY